MLRHSTIETQNELQAEIAGKPTALRLGRRSLCTNKWIACLTFVAIAMGAVTAGQAQDGYPSRPIRFIVPYSPGGGSDIAARVVALALTESLGQAVVVDNRPGAGGTLGTNLVAKSDPNGYTLLLSNVGPIAINATLYDKLPYDPITDFAPVSLICFFPNVLVIHPALPANSMRELALLAKTRPAQLTFASAGVGSSTHLAGELFKRVAGINMIHVPYKGGGQVVPSLIAGEVSMYFGTMTAVLPHVKNGRLRALAVAGRKRSVAAPELPTAGEAGYPGVVAENWSGMHTPSGTPPAVVRRLNDKLVRILHQPEVEKKLLEQGAEPAANTPEEFAAFIVAEIAKWAKVIKESGARAE